MSERVAAAFAAAFPGGEVEGEELTRALMSVVDAAVVAWGDRFVADGDFGRRLAEAAAGESSPVAALRRISAADFYLAHAALEDREWAQRALRDGPLAIALSAVRRRYGDGILDECRQRVLETILVGERAALRRYAGQAALSWWLRVIALRCASRLRRDREVPSESLDEHVASEDDELLGALKGRYRASFRAAFAKAIEGLSLHDRLLLKQNALDGVTIDEIAAARGVHRATAARWLAKIRDRVRETTCQLMADELGLESGEAGDVLELVQSRLDASISRLLA